MEQAASAASVAALPAVMRRPLGRVARLALAAWGVVEEARDLALRSKGRARWCYPFQLKITGTRSLTRSEMTS